MPPFSDRVLRNAFAVIAVVGQLLLDSDRTLAIWLLGIALAIWLVDGWWYLRPAYDGWWYMAAVGLIGLWFWRSPRGWFFLAWVLIDTGTKLRAEAIIRNLRRAMVAEEARQSRLAQLARAGEQGVLDE